MPACFRSLVLICHLLLSGYYLAAQKPLNPVVNTGPKSKIMLLEADSLVGENISGQDPTRTFYGNSRPVKFLHQGVYLLCRIATLNAATNSLEAYGNIRIEQSDTLTITGDTLYYDGNLRKAKILGKKVVLKDKKTTLESKEIKYDINSAMTYYPKPGVIYQDSVVLRSNSGIYNVATKFFNYLGDVEILHPDFVLCTDTLDYDSNIKKAIFKSRTTIRSSDGDLVAHKGYYFTDSKKSRFFGQSKVENEKYSLSADTLDFNSDTEEGIGIGHVTFYSKKDKLWLNGDFGEKKAGLGYTKMKGNTLMRTISEKDTLYIRADSIIAYQSIASVIPPKSHLDTTRKSDSLRTDSLQIVHIQPLSAAIDSSKRNSSDRVEFILADGNVKIFRDDFQAIADSLTYNLVDSTITFIQKPVIWGVKNQMEADTIIVWLVNNKIEHMRLKQNSFIISEDTVLNFNQIKGREIVANFDSLAAIQDVRVNGNGESIYFTLDETNALIGMNKVACSRMYLKFDDQKVKRISFAGQVESKLIPPLDLKSQNKTLEDFNWKPERKPTKKEVLGSNFVE